MQHPVSKYCKLSYHNNRNLKYLSNSYSPRETRSPANKAQQTKVKSINSNWHCIDDLARACIERDLKIILEKIRRMDKVVLGRSITIVLRIYLHSFLSVTQMYRTRTTYDRVHTWRTTGGESRWKTARRIARAA